MAIDKLIPQYLNRDDDERILKSFEMIDALNVRISHEEDGDAGVIKNIEGNQSVASKSSADAIPATGLNKVIGATSSEAHKCIYFFLYNANGNHGIYKYTAAPGTEDSDVYQKVYESSSLNFNLQGYVDSDLIVNQKGEHLLYFTDNRNEPRKINATKALSSSYSSTFTSGTSAEKELFLSVCKQPPLKAPSFEFKSNPNLRRNQLSDALFQFAYQYVYDDGEQSALSPYSKIAVSPTHLAFNNAQKNIYQSENNEIEISLDCSVGPVKKIRVYARRGNGGYFVKVDEVDNAQSQSSVKVVFRNDGLFNQLDESTANKPFDAVPQLAGTQTFSNNRLFYGNYVEGFDNVNTEAIGYPVYYNVIEANDVFVNERTRFNAGPAFSNFNDEYHGLAMAIGSRFEDFQNNSGTSYGGADFPTGNFENVQQSLSGKPIGVEVDLSSIPAGGVEEDATLNISFSIDGSGIGMGQKTSYTGTSSDTDYDKEAFIVDIDLKNPNGSPVGSHADTEITILQPAKATIVSTNGNISYTNFNREGTLNNMQIVGGFDFSVSLDVPAGTPRVDILNLLATKINGANGVVVSVASKTSGDGVIQSITNTFSSGAPFSITQASELGPGGLRISENVYQPPSLTGDNLAYKRWINIEWGGTFTMVPDAFADQESGRVLVRFMNEDVNLTANKAFTASPNFYPDDKFDDAVNNGIPGAGHTYLGEDISCTIKTGEVSSNGSSHPLKDGSFSNTTYATAIRDMSVSGSGALIPSGSTADKNKSFKSGATHEFGAVYFDKRNRASGVQRLSSVEVAATGDPRRNGQQGRTEIDFRLLHTPPEWAHRWAPVYSKNTTYDSFLQFTVSEALLPNLSLFRDILSPVGVTEEDSLSNSRAIATALGDDIRSAIFLAMRPLEGKNNSYKEFKGGQIDYQYVEGDILRVRSHLDSQGQRQYPSDVEFTITGYNYFVDNEENPLVVSQTSSGDESKEDDTYRRSGWFLSVRDNERGGFSRSDVALAKDLFSQACVIEILRPKKDVSEPVYFEIGESFPIVEVSGERTHGGSRSNSTQGNVSIEVTSSQRFFSATRLYVGDKLTVPAGGNTTINSVGYVFVAGVRPVSGGYSYFVSGDKPFKQAATGLSYTGAYVSSSPTSYNSTHYGVVTLNDGDVYMRDREMLVNASEEFTPTSSQSTTLPLSPIVPRKQTYKRFDIEDASASDFFDSKEISIGRPHAETPDQARIRRTTSVTYSDPFAFDSSVLNLSSFNPSLFPYYDMPSKHGEVVRLIDGNESLTVLQESKASLLPINRNVVELGSDNAMVASTNVIGTPSFMAGTYGPGNSPEGVVSRFGQVYFSDVRSGVVCRIDGGGITPISSEKMESYFEGLFGGVNNAVARPRIPSGFDPENSEYIITTEPIDFKKLVINQSTVGYAASAPTGADYPDVKVQPKFETDLLLTWDTEPLDWDESEWANTTCVPKWEDMHRGIIYLDRINETSGVYIEPNSESLTDSFRIDTIVEGQLYRGSAQISMQDHTVDFCLTLIETDADGGTELMSIADAVDPEQATVAWSPNAQKWLTFYSFIPDLYANVQNRFFSFKDGQMWYHNKLSTRNSFYGTTYRSELELISKGNPSSIKYYKAMSLEGNATWKATLSNELQRTAVINANFWSDKEGMKYASIPRVTDSDITNELTTDYGSSAIRVVGTVASVDTSNNTITFDSNVNKSPVNTAPQAICLRYSSGGTAWLPTSVNITGIASGSTSTVNTNVSPTLVQVGDVIANVSLGGIDGDTLRGYYTKVKLENTDAEARELYAVNLVYESSSLHNDNNQ